MRLVFVFLSLLLVLGLGDAARRTTTAARRRTYLEHPRQQRQGQCEYTLIFSSFIPCTLFEEAKRGYFGSWE